MNKMQLSLCEHNLICVLFVIYYFRTNWEYTISRLLLIWAAYLPTTNRDDKLSFYLFQFNGFECRIHYQFSCRSDSTQFTRIFSSSLAPVTATQILCQKVFNSIVGRIITNKMRQEFSPVRRYASQVTYVV